MTAGQVDGDARHAGRTAGSIARRLPMFKRPQAVFGPLAALTLVLFGLSFLGSDGPVHGELSTGQRIANVTMPLMVLCLLVLVVLGIAQLAVGRIKRRV
jgi:hypothetical protein